MVDKKINKNEKNNDVMHLVHKKIDFFRDVIQKTILHTQKNKSLHLLLDSEKKEDLDLNLYATQQRVALLADVFQCNVTVAISD